MRNRISHEQDLRLHIEIEVEQVRLPVLLAIVSEKFKLEAAVLCILIFECNVILFLDLAKTPYTLDCFVDALR